MTAHRGRTAAMMRTSQTRALLHCSRVCVGQLRCPRSPSGSWCTYPVSHRGTHSPWQLESAAPFTRLRPAQQRLCSCGGDARMCAFAAAIVCTNLQYRTCQSCRVPRRCQYVIVGVEVVVSREHVAYTCMPSRATPGCRCQTSIQFGASGTDKNSVVFNTGTQLQKIGSLSIVKLFGSVSDVVRCNESTAYTAIVAFLIFMLHRGGLDANTRAVTQCMYDERRCSRRASCRTCTC